MVFAFHPIAMNRHMVFAFPSYHNTAPHICTQPRARFQVRLTGIATVLISRLPFWTQSKEIFVLDLFERMADPLTIVGGLASIIQIADALTRLSSELRHCIRTIRSAPREVQHFSLDLTNFTASLRMFYNHCATWLDGLDDSVDKNERKEHIAGIIRECDAVEEGFDQLLRRFFPEPSTIMVFLTPIDRIRWYFRKSQVVGLKLSLESAKSSVTLLSTLYMCEDLRKRIQEMEAAHELDTRDLHFQLYGLSTIVPCAKLIQES